jgi:signal transduction histidine kinase
MLWGHDREERMAADSGDSERQAAPLDILKALGYLIAGPGNRPLLWERRGRWQVGFRWIVTPAMLSVVLVGRWLGFEFAVEPVVAVAAGIAVYNTAFAWIFRRWAEPMRLDPGLDRKVTILQAVCDYAAVFSLIYFMGGASSPLALFLIFHVVIVAIQFFSRIAYVFAAWAAGGMWLLLAGQILGWLPTHAVLFRGQPLYAADRPAYTAVFLLCFTATVFVTAAMVGQIMRLLRSRVGKLASTTTELALANQKLNGLYAVVRSIGSERSLDPILKTVTSKLAAVLEIPAVAVRLLSEDSRTMQYVASTGLPDPVTGRAVPVDEDPLDRRVTAGETVVLGRIDQGRVARLQPEMETLGIASAALTPLRVENRVIGALGIYSDKPDRFQERDVEFLRLTADLVAIAIEDARANEAIDALMRERTQFMLEVAHNLRAPLAASLDILELLRDGYLGEINERQLEYLQRIEQRLRTLHRVIGGLLTIGRTRDWSREIPDVVVDIRELAEHARHTFEKQAAAKRLRFEVAVEAGLPAVDSGADLLEQIVENLISNSIKYTPEGGEVAVRFAGSGADELRIEVQDNGIGIPAAEQGRLFHEFFRASNAKKATSEGTGLGLALVKQSVERHKGRLELTSEEGRGTTVVIHLPVRQARQAAS